ncbi:MAG: dihydroxy-acid dehydratase [Eubacteriales bacterium]|nr:dihydroxy-acid dehydratase [Eubacteriales bacterium]
MNTRSQDIMTGPEWANVRALYKSGGCSDKELRKPLIGIVDAYSTMCPGHTNLRLLADRVRDGIYAAGGTPVSFSTIGACDGVTMGHDGMKYVLPTREMIANDIEAMTEGHRLDGLVLIGSCDKIVPGMLIGALRVNVPAIFLNGGPSLPGRMTEHNPYGGIYIDHSAIQQSEGALKSGKITEEEFTWIENNAVPTIGSCAMLGTANSMCCLAEAMGMSLPGSAAIPAVYSRRYSIAFETGMAVMDLVRKDIRPRDIITRESIFNAYKVNCAIGGSTNVVLHLLAIAYAAEIDMNIFELGECGDEIPHLVPMIPAGSATLLDFYEAGGIPALMQTMRPVLDLTGITCTACTSEENIAPFRNANQQVILPLEHPVHRRGGLRILKGSLAPDGAVTKPSAIPDAALTFTGPARIYESEEDALKGIRNMEVQEGDVVVIRNEGPKGGPGMPEMYKAMKLLVGMGLGAKVCLITDGRFSGSNNGCFVGHICPEAIDDGPIAYLKDGDIISVDVPGKSIDAPEVDFDERRKTVNPVTHAAAKGCLYQYRRNVQSASRGAVIPTRD